MGRLITGRPYRAPAPMAVDVRHYLKRFPIALTCERVDEESGNLPAIEAIGYRPYRLVLEHHGRRMRCIVTQGPYDQEPTIQAVLQYLAHEFRTLEQAGHAYATWCPLVDVEPHHPSATVQFMDVVEKLVRFSVLVGLTGVDALVKGVVTEHGAPS